MAKDDPTFKYKSDNDSNSADDSTNAATKPSVTDRDAFTWTASEYIDHQQGLGWYIALTLITLILSVGIYFITDYFAAGTILLLGIIVGVFASRTPNQLTYELSAGGLKIGEKFYPYSTFKSFSVDDDGALVNISLFPIKRLMPTISIFFDPAEEGQITSVLGEHLPSEEHRVDRIETISRRLRL